MREIGTMNPSVKKGKSQASEVIKSEISDVLKSYASAAKNEFKTTSAI